MELALAVAVLGLLVGGQAVDEKMPPFEAMIRTRVVWSVRHGFDILADEPRSKAVIRRTLELLRDRLEP